jgi:hypothetical protein
MILIRYHRASALLDLAIGAREQRWRASDGADAPTREQVLAA